MLSFKYTLGELLDVGWSLRRRSPLCRTIDRLVFLVIPILALATAWSVTEDFTVLAILSVLGILSWCTFSPWLHRCFSDLCTIVIALNRYGKLPRGGYIKADVSNDGVLWSSDYLDRFTDWLSIADVFVDGEFLFIQVDGVTFNWIPKRVIPHDDGLSNVVERCADYREQALCIQLPLDGETAKLRQNIKNLDEEFRRLRDALGVDGPTAMPPQQVG